MLLLFRERSKNGPLAGKEKSLAIYHNEVKMITRGEGRSACAASAYISCSAIYNDYDGIQHDYTKKQGLVWEHVFLPSMAPVAWQDRETLWNLVEAAEKEKDSRLGREHVVALPIELDKQGWIALLTDYIQTQFVDEGMCVDVAIHDPDGHNPHAHIITTVRPLNEDGTWQYKTEKEYLCIRNGEEKGFTAAEFKEAKNEGWEKQYPFKVGKKKEYMTPSAAEAQGYERASKYPKSTKFGRQNPITARWNSEAQLLIWREAWAKMVNRHLEQTGHDERIDHRSFVDQGRDEQPTIHESVSARIVEKKGGISERCEINRQIRQDNALLRGLKALVARLTASAKDAITNLARKMETVRANLIGLFFVLRHHTVRKNEAKTFLEHTSPLVVRYDDLRSRIKEIISDLRRLRQEKDSLPLVSILKRRDLSVRIEALETDLHDLREKEKAIMQQFGKSDQAGMQIIRNQMAFHQVIQQRADRMQPIIRKAIRNEKNAFSVLNKQADAFDSQEVQAARMSVRPEIEGEMKSKLKQKIGMSISERALAASSANAEEQLEALSVRTDKTNQMQNMKPCEETEKRAIDLHKNEKRKQQNYDL